MLGGAQLAKKWRFDRLFSRKLQSSMGFAHVTPARPLSSRRHGDVPSLCRRLTVAHVPRARTVCIKILMIRSLQQRWPNKFTQVDEWQCLRPGGGHASINSGLRGPEAHPRDVCEVVSLAWAALRLYTTAAVLAGGLEPACEPRSRRTRGI